jgi:hypothetical protein
MCNQDMRTSTHTVPTNLRSDVAQMVGCNGTSTWRFLLVYAISSLAVLLPGNTDSLTAAVPFIPVNDKKDRLVDGVHWGHHC